MCVHHHGDKRMAQYYITAYQMCESPEELPEGTEELWNGIFRDALGGGIIFDEDIGADLATMLYSEEFLKLSSIVDDEHGATVLAFKIHLLKHGVFNGEEPLQLMWSLDNSGSVGAYMLAYPDSEISSVEDMEILTDEGVARAALGAWSEGIPYTLCPTFIYKPDEPTGKFVRESEFSEDMS